MYKDTKWAKEIISLQDDEGKWGYFHTLFADSKSSYTTEKALKRLEMFGYTIEDIINRHKDKDIIMGSDDNGANNGVILLKNSQISINFLQKTFTNRNFFHSKTPEQNAMFYYLEGEFAPYLGVEPSSFFNAYLDGYADFVASKDKIKNWSEDSFILHLMTLSHEDRCTIFKEQLLKRNIICMTKPPQQSRIARQT